MRGWCGEGGGRRVQDGEHMYTCGGFISIFTFKVITDKYDPVAIYFIALGSNLYTAKLIQCLRFKN